MEWCKWSASSSKQEPCYPAFHKYTGVSGLKRPTFLKSDGHACSFYRAAAGIQTDIQTYWLLGNSATWNIGSVLQPIRELGETVN